LPGGTEKALKTSDDDRDMNRTPSEHNIAIPTGVVINEKE